MINIKTPFENQAFGTIFGAFLGSYPLNKILLIYFQKVILLEVT